MKYSFATDRGKKRSINQDCCTVFCPDEQSCFAIVCDGMGGAAAGEIASSMVVETVEERVKEGWRTGISDESVRNLLLTSITAANINVFDKSQAEISYQGMGTTVVAAAIQELRSDGIDFPKELDWMLQHMILSHHGEKEYGSPVLPMCPEALALHMIDNLDAKLFVFLDRAAEEGDDPLFSSYDPIFQQQFYKYRP